MTDISQEGVPLSHALGTGTLGQPQRARPSLKALAARVLEGAREAVPVSHAMGNGTVGQAVASPVIPKSAEVAAWGAEEWRAFFDERAGIAEFDSGFSREDAEQRAFECCIVEWLNRQPQQSNAGHCAWCRKPDRDGHAVVPFGTEADGHTWLHPECWNDWHEIRRDEARKAMSQHGIRATPRHT